jgi:predicted Zn-dependent protease
MELTKYMNKIYHFFIKLLCTLIIVGTANCFAPISNNNFTQVVYAKKTKKSQKNKVPTSWRWKSAKAFVYVDLNNNQDLISATNDAIDAWNDTGAFNFIKTENKKKANIVIEQVYSPNTNYAGYTTFHYYTKNKILYSAVTRLNIFYLDNFSAYDYSRQRVINTVEHELGHAIGLKHNNGQSVMYPVGSLYSIEPSDIATVKKLYHK